LSLVKGLALARRLPIIGIPTLDVIAAAQPTAKQPLIALLQAGRTRIAFSAYKSQKKEWQAEGGVRSGTVDELLNEIESPTIVAGELSAEDRKKFSKKKTVLLASLVNCLRRPSVLAELAWARWQNDEVDGVGGGGGEGVEDGEVHARSDGSPRLGIHDAPRGPVRLPVPLVRPSALAVAVRCRAALATGRLPRLAVPLVACASQL
jgi:hypothetical protein